MDEVRNVNPLALRSTVASMQGARPSGPGEVSALATMLSSMQGMNPSGQQGASPDPRVFPGADLRNARINRLLIGNRHLNFVDRIINRQNYPVLKQDPRMKRGDVATHVMSWSDDGKGRYFVWPQVIWDEKKKALEWLEPAEAERYAMKTGEFIEVGSAEEAEFLSSQYKRYWGEVPR